ncbi:MAG: glycosyltransferase family 4 protein [Candidatus Levybacteria bacterium]|nr:glycosyltransferase family 4 protein [Candidatus Levybacteria bacterium]
MKVKLPVFIISGKSPLEDPGGYPAYARILAITLTSLGYPVHTLAIGKKQGVEKTEYGDIHILNTKLLKLFPFLHHLALAGLPYYSFIFAKEIKRIVKEKKIAKFILWGMGPWAFPGAFLKIFPQKNVHMTMMSSYFTSTRHEMKGALDAIRVKDYGLIPKIKYLVVYEIVARVFNLFEKITLDFCDLVVIHYNSSKKIIREGFNVEDKKIHMFPWYAETFKREGDKSIETTKYSRPLIVSICRQDPRKGINFIIHAIKILSQKYPNITCLIVGSGSFYELNKKLAEKLNITKKVIFLGFVADINPILTEADITVVVPLRQGSSALTVLESMSYGKTLVVSNCDGIPEDIKDNFSGLIVESGNEASLAKALEKLIKNPALRKRLGENAYKTYKSRFGFDKMKSHIEKMLSTNIKA